jgi:predicted NBD/HSP70 family sugar kinase
MKIIEDETSDYSNIRAVLNIIEKNEKLSRAGIAKRLGLSRTTLSTLVINLMESGLVKETGTSVDGIGRPGISLDISTDKWFAIGAEYHSGKWVFVITDLKGSVCREMSIPVPHPEPGEFKEKLIEGLSEIVKNVDGRLLPAIGIGTPGFVDCDQGIIIQADDLGWQNVRVKEYVKKYSGYNSYIINRHRASGLAEARFGAGRGVNSLIYIGIGTGISSAIITGGGLVNGISYSAGEIGYMILKTTESLTQSGQYGSLHTLVSGIALKKMAEIKIKSNESSLSGYLEKGIDLSGELISSEAAKGDPVALSCLQEAAAWLSIALINMNTILNPDKIIFGGPVGGQEGPLIDMIRNETEKRAKNFPIPSAKIERGILGHNTGALGAACLILDRKLELIMETQGF